MFTEEELEGKSLADGIYEVPEDVEIIELQRCEDWRLSHFEDEAEDVKAFIQRFPNFAIASAYETNYVMLLSREVQLAKVKYIGSGLNYGSTTLLEGCPKRLLILAEND